MYWVPIMENQHGILKLAYKFNKIKRIMVISIVNM